MKCLLHEKKIVLNRKNLRYRSIFFLKDRVAINHHKQHDPLTGNEIKNWGFGCLTKKLSA